MKIFTNTLFRKSLDSCLIILSLLLVLFPSTASALTQDDLNSIIGQTPFYDPTTGTTGTGVSCSGGSSYGGTLDQYMQAEALIESDDQPAEGNATGASGKYQFEASTWVSWAQTYYGPAQQFTYASAAPENVQDAVMYLGNVPIYKAFQGDIFAMAVEHYWPALAQVAFTDPTSTQLNYTPYPGDNSVTVGAYGTLVADAVSSGTYNGRTLSSVNLTYTGAPDFTTWLAKVGGAPTQPTATPAADNPAIVTCTTATSPGVAAGSFVYYSQCDPTWANDPYGDPGGTICSSGCGPTSVAMVVATLADSSVTPDQTASLSMSTGGYDPGAGTTWAFLASGPEHWGLQAQQLGTNMNQAISVLEAGGLVIAAGEGSVPFTSEGHIIVLKGIASDGNILVGDPDTAHTGTEYSANAILSAGLQDLVGITK